MNNPPILTPEIERLLKVLESDENDAILPALHRLAALRYTPALPSFGRLLRHPIRDIRNAAVEAVLTLLMNTLNVERGMIMLKSEENDTLQPRALQGIQPDSWATAGTGPIVESAAKTGEALLTTNAQHDANFHNSSSIVSYSLRSVAAVPIHAGEEVIGVIYVDHPVRSGMLSNEAFRSLVSAAEAVGMGYDEVPRPGSAPAPSWLSELQKLERTEEDDELDTVPLYPRGGDPDSEPPRDASEGVGSSPAPIPSTPIREPAADTFKAFPPLIDDLVPLLRVGPDEEQDTVLTPPRAREEGEIAAEVAVDDEEYDEDDTLPIAPLPRRDDIETHLGGLPGGGEQAAQHSAEPNLQPPKQHFFPPHSGDDAPEPDETESAAPEPEVAEASAVDKPAEKSPAFDPMSSHDMMQWMETLAKRQAALDDSSPTGETGKATGESSAKEAKTALRDDQVIPPPARPLPAPQPAPQPDAPAAAPADAEVNAPADGLVPQRAAVPAAPQPAQPAAPAPAEPRAVQFSAFQPIDVAPEVWHPLTAYVHYSDQGAAVEADALRQLGEQIETMRRLSKPAQVKVREGALITATPSLPGFQFNPPSLSIAFYEQWHRFDFKLRAMNAPLYQATNGQITFTVEGVIVGDVPLSIFVGDGVAATPKRSSAKAYQAIFCSYSRRDLTIIARVERAYKALGLQYLRDLEVLRSGETWTDGLRKLIDEADIFQLFWSAHSASSEHVRMEWEHALSLQRGEAFIRPVHWEMPMPPAPRELAHLHFTYAPDLSQENA